MTDTITVPLTDVRVARAVELVWREAELLDRKDYLVWQELYTDDARYIVPIDPDTEDFAGTLNMIYDDARMRAMRVTRMTEGYAIAAVDAARTVRTVSRFVPETVTDTEVVLRSAQVLIAYKRGRHDIWAADVRHRVRLSDSGDRIAEKVVRLVDSEDAVPAAGFLL
ncbi:MULTISPECIES: aromatic-ring-hydroxylating dioxygenase subunit beta [Amycolatopsis]|uniref:3-phenylpropionate/cinnamic acid dioxygenase small subunit n=1 Tax=Amycolatopsis thermoflava TaxID=84480 RepID=A0A3N2H9A9_9PSEU|nr:aromatic-ring-hydroxylating dioxygenase subunit beta [Amycolatopsis thermoflava]ROS45099.1 3-phenylpropionate/cinnamic acid dioxygenase small subunit [Amycolatopsis thermoflava]